MRYQKRPPPDNKIKCLNKNSTYCKHYALSHKLKIVLQGTKNELLSLRVKQFYIVYHQQERHGQGFKTYHTVKQKV